MTADGPRITTTAEHDPCCSSHGVTMTCAEYRRTHFVEVRPCCGADAARLRAEGIDPEGPWQTRVDRRLRPDAPQSPLDRLMADSVRMPRADFMRMREALSAALGFVGGHHPIAGRLRAALGLRADGTEDHLAARPDAPQPTPVDAAAVERATAALFGHRYDMDDAECSCGWTLDTVPVDEDGPSAEDLQVTRHMATVALAAAGAGEAEVEVSATHPAHWERHGHPGEPCPPYGCYGGAQYGAGVDPTPLDALPYFTFDDPEVDPVEAFVRREDVRPLLAARGDAAPTVTAEQVEAADQAVLDAVASVPLGTWPGARRVTTAVLAALGIEVQP